MLLSEALSFALMHKTGKVELVSARNLRGALEALLIFLGLRRRGGKLNVLTNRVGKLALNCRKAMNLLNIVSLLYNIAFL